MWKKIVIGSVVPFVASTYFYFQTDSALTAPDGEIAHLQKQLNDVADKYKEFNIDRYMKLYAELRTESFSAKKQEYDSQKTELDAEDATVTADISKAQSSVTQADEDYKRLTEELNKFLKDATAAAGFDESDDADFSGIAEKIADLISSNEELEKQVAMEEAQISALNAKSEEYIRLTAAGKKLNQDRQARISPVELDCRVLNADPQWDYIILDAGVDRGIVIGSRLAVMRGDEKICELNVTLVESSRTSCDVVYSTLKPGERVRVGDKVVAVRNNK